MPGKVSNIFKSAVTNLIGNSIASAFTQAASQGQTEKIAAKLLNKSPLEIGNANVPPQTGHMALNPFEYGQIYYPETTSQLGEGHYMIFDIVEVDPEKFKKVMKVDESDETQKRKKRNLPKEEEEGADEEVQEQAPAPNPVTSFSEFMSDKEELGNVFDKESFFICFLSK